MIGIPYARVWFDGSGEPHRVCPVCGAWCEMRMDDDGETELDTYPDHYASEHEKEMTP